MREKIKDALLLVAPVLGAVATLLAVPMASTIWCDLGLQSCNQDWRPVAAIVLLSAYLSVVFVYVFYDVIVKHFRDKAKDRAPTRLHFTAYPEGDVVDTDLELLATYRIRYSGLHPCEMLSIRFTATPFVDGSFSATYPMEILASTGTASMTNKTFNDYTIRLLKPSLLQVKWAVSVTHLRVVGCTAFSDPVEFDSSGGTTSLGFFSNHKSIK